MSVNEYVPEAKSAINIRELKVMLYRPLPSVTVVTALPDGVGADVVGVLLVTTCAIFATIS